MIGIGFRERDEAFDFKNCLNDYVKFINRMELASNLASNGIIDSTSTKPSTTLASTSDDDTHTDSYSSHSLLPSQSGNTFEVTLWFYYFLQLCFAFLFVLNLPNDFIYLISLKNE